MLRASEKILTCKIGSRIDLEIVMCTMGVQGQKCPFHPFAFSGNKNLFFFFTSRQKNGEKRRRPKCKNTTVDTRFFPNSEMSYCTVMLRCRSRFHQTRNALLKDEDLKKTEELKTEGSWESLLW